MRFGVTELKCSVGVFEDPYFSMNAYLVRCGVVGCLDVHSYTVLQNPHKWGKSHRVMELENHHRIRWVMDF